MPAADVTGTFSAYRLPRGRHGLAPELVAENQRWRILGGAAEALEGLGYARLTSSAIAHRAGVSTSTFYRHFDNVGDCLLAAYEMAMECILDVVADACDPDFDRPRRVRQAIAAALRFLAAEPALARLLGTEAPAGVPEIAAARERLVDRLAVLLDDGGDGAERRRVAGALALISDRIASAQSVEDRGFAAELAAVFA